MTSALDLACGVFRRQGVGGKLPPQYIFHLPRTHKSNVGLDRQKKIPGKTIITRAVQKKPGESDRLALFNSFAHSEPGAASSKPCHR
jgi:hypothetical protein